MVKTIVRFGTSIVLGLALALPFVRWTAPQTHAQVSEFTDATELIPSEFSDQVGLGKQDVRTSIGQLINVALGFLGIIAVIIILYGGFKWMTAAGNDEKVAESKRLIIAGIIGLAIILSAYAITTFVINELVDATNTEVEV
jgi:amino acid transporter